MKVKVIDLLGTEIDAVEIAEDFLIDKPHKQAMFDAVLAENAGERQGTHSTLTKAEVRGGGRKPFKQKHTGRARQGSIRGPHYVGGGVAFGPKPTRNYKLKINKKITKLAFKSALTVSLTENRLLGLTNEITLEQPSTKSASQLAKNIKSYEKRILVVLFDKNENYFKSWRNIPKANIKLWNQVSTRDLLNNDQIIVQVNALNKWTEVYK